jgi:hypothetical protein
LGRVRGRTDGIGEGEAERGFVDPVFATGFGHGVEWGNHATHAKHPVAEKHADRFGPTCHHFRDEKVRISKVQGKGHRGLLCWNATFAFCSERVVAPAQPLESMGSPTCPDCPDSATGDSRATGAVGDHTRVLFAVHKLVKPSS